jgi:hypothetical protein
MAELLLDRIRTEIRDRVRELEPLAHEYGRLEAAATALGGPVDTHSTRPAPAASPKAPAKRRPKVSVQSVGLRRARGMDHRERGR